VLPERCAVVDDLGVQCVTHDPVSQPRKKEYVNYDSVAKNYAQCVHPKEVSSVFYSRLGSVIAERVGRGASILDLGCGPGFLDIELAKNGCDVISGDVSLNMLRILRSQIRHLDPCSVTPCRMNAYALPLEDGSVDAVLALNLLYFVSDPDAVLGEMRRVLKRDGILIVNGRNTEESSASEVSHKIRRYYSEGLRNCGVKEFFFRGWGMAPCDHLSTVFQNHEILDDPRLVFEFTTNIGWFYRRLAGRYSAFQIAGVDENTHNLAMETVRNRIVDEYGPGFEDIRDQHTRREQLSVHYDGC
jgi:ubiquinone/menaquinone biosynthesis C-methylase UbiE